MSERVDLYSSYSNFSEQVLAAIRRTLIIDRAYRAGLAFAMNQIPLD